MVNAPIVNASGTKFVSPLHKVRPMESLKHLVTYGAIQSIISQETIEKARLKLDTYQGAKVPLADEAKLLIADYIQRISNDSIQINSLKMRSARIKDLIDGVSVARAHGEKFKMMGNTLLGEGTAGSKIALRESAQKLLKEVSAFDSALDEYQTNAEAALLRATEESEANHDGSITIDEDTDDNQRIAGIETVEPYQSPAMNPNVTVRYPSAVPIASSQNNLHKGSHQVQNNANAIPATYRIDQLENCVRGMTNQMSQLYNRMDQLMNVVLQPNQGIDSSFIRPVGVPRSNTQNQFDQSGALPAAVNIQAPLDNFGDRGSSHQNTLGNTTVSLGFNISKIDEMVKREAQPNLSPASSDLNGVPVFRNSALKPELPEFSGNPGTTQFKHFWAAFRLLVHQTNLTDTEKILILYQKVVPPASDLLHHNPYRAGGYVEAIQRLLRTYGSSLSDTTSLYNELCDLPLYQPNQYDQIQHTIARMRTILEEIADTDQSLISSGQIHKMVISKIPEQYVTQIRTQRYECTLDELLNFAECEVITRKQMASCRNESTAQYNQNYDDGYDLQNGNDNYDYQQEHQDECSKYHLQNGVYQEQAVLAVEKQRKNVCSFCRNASHQTKDCCVITSLNQRRQMFKNENRCMKCERLGHQQAECRISVKCPSCNRDDHCPAFCPNQDFPKSGQGRNQ